MKNFFKTLLKVIRRKLFATYEYEKSFASMDAKIASISALVQCHIDISKHNLLLSSCLSRKISAGNQRLRILFLVNNLNAWHAIEELIRKLALETNFDVIVASINKRFPGQDCYSGEEDVHLFLNDQGVSHIRLGMSDSFRSLEIIMALSPDVIFRQSQWDADYPPGLSSEMLNFTRLAIVPYGICNIVKNVISDEEIKNSAVDSLYHRRCWRVYCSTEFMLSIAVRDNVLQGRTFRVVGHPKVDYLLDVKPLWPFNVNSTHRVLWSPHHSITNGWTDFGLFLVMWKKMLAIANRLTTINFVFCPHPALVTQANGGGMPDFSASYKKFIREWSVLPNCHEYYGADYASVAAASSLIVTDGISMLMEGQLLRKEIIFTERERHVPFNSIGNLLLTGVHTIKEIDSLENSILDIINGVSPSLCKKQIENVELLFPTRNAVDNIISDLENLTIL